MRYVFWGAAALCMIYYIVIVLYAGFSASFAWFWPLLAVILLAGGFLPGVFAADGAGRTSAVGVGVLVLLAAGAALFVYGLCLIVSGMRSKGEKDLDYVIVLGAQVKGDRPSLSLKKRLEAALSYAEVSPDTKLVLSGGQGPGEDVTEAACMQEWLLSHGVSAERLLLEERSTSTAENLLFCDELTGCKNARTGIITNDFHVYRALRLAGRQGYTDVCGIAAGGAPIMEVHFLVREVFALWKEKLTGNI